MTPKERIIRAIEQWYMGKMPWEQVMIQIDRALEETKNE